MSQGDKTMKQRIKRGQALAWIGGLAAAAVLVGCHGGERVGPATRTGAHAARTLEERSLAEMSSMRAAGTAVTYVETPDGAAIEFTVGRHALASARRASGGGVAEVRRLVRAIARAHDSPKRLKASTAYSDECNCHLMLCCAGTRVEVKDTPGGATLHFAPDPAPLRKAVAAEAARMAR